MGGEDDSNTESTGKSAKSYGVPRRFNGGHGSKGKLVLGKLEELGVELVYKVNTKDQADMYIRTMEATGDYVGVEYGWNMRILVNQGKEAVFTKEWCQSNTASPVTFPVLNLRTCYYRVDQSKERTEYMCVTAEECSCSRHV
jgi:hypothetical protein